MKAEREDAGQSTAWLVIVGPRVLLAGTSELPGVELDPDDLAAVCSFTAGQLDPATARDELVDALGRTQLPPAVPGPSPTSVSETSGRTSAPGGLIDLAAPVLLNVAAGRIIGWSRTLGSAVELDPVHVRVLAALGHHQDPVAPEQIVLEGTSVGAELEQLLDHGFIHRVTPAEPVAVSVEGPKVRRETEASSAAAARTRETDSGESQSSGRGSADMRQTDRSRRSAHWLLSPFRRRKPVPVWPATCADTEVGNALGLGMVIAAAKDHDGGRLASTYDFRPIQITAADALADVEATGRPGVLMLSAYIWSLEADLELARRVKQASPDTVVVIGGPSAPKYEADAIDFFASNPQIDVLVRGEGEVTGRELLDALDGDLGRLEHLTEVPGLTVRARHGIVRTADRPRLDDLNVVPSPYLMGLFDHLSPQQGIWALETNRGCPYGCTFCDWGSATKSRIRKFDLERVTSELDWMSRHGVQSIFVADANFGIFERDLELTRYMADLHGAHGVPKSIIASFAKNTTKYTVPIIQTLIDSGLYGDVAIAFQTTDVATLENISRTNIKIDNYDKLARDVRADGLPILADIMIGLPGSTLETLKADLQHCVDADVTARVFGTMVLPNSPMNHPDYRAEHGIRTDSFQQVISTNSFGPEDREEIVRFRDAFRLADHFGVLRHVIRYEGHRSGRRAIDVLSDLYTRSLERPGDYPLLSFMFRSGRRYLIEPMSWDAFYGEVVRFFECELSSPNDSGLRTVLKVQQALMPAPGRAFPDVVHLEHDYVAFYREVLRPRDGNSTGRELADFPPTSMTVSDPDGLSSTWLREMFQIERSPEGFRNLRHEGEFWEAFNWELESPLKRALRSQYYDSANSLPVLPVEAHRSVTADRPGSLSPEHPAAASG